MNEHFLEKKNIQGGSPPVVSGYTSLVPKQTIL